MMIRPRAGRRIRSAAVALLAGTETLAQGMSAGAADVNVLNVALGLEHEAISACQLGAESGLLQKRVLDVAVLFQGHHKGHRDALASTIRKLGASPVAEKSMEDYARALDAAALKAQADVLELAARLELGATNACARCRANRTIESAAWSAQRPLRVKILRNAGKS